MAEGVEGGVGCGVDEDGGGRREQEESEGPSLERSIVWLALTGKQSCLRCPAEAR